MTLYDKYRLISYEAKEEGRTEGRAEGRAEGRTEGRAEGMGIARREIVRSKRAKGQTIEFIADDLDMSIEEVKAALEIPV